MSDDYKIDCAYHEATHAVVALSVGATIDCVSIEPLPGRCTQSGIKDTACAVAVLSAGTIGDCLRQNLNSPNGKGPKHAILTHLFHVLKEVCGCTDLDDTDFGKIANGFSEMNSKELRHAFSFAIDIARSNWPLIRIVAERLAGEGKITGADINTLAGFVKGVTT